MLPWARSFGGGMRAASIGVSVSATTSEIITEAATVMPNSERKLPTMPSTKITGMKTTAIETVEAVAAKAISRVPLRGGLVRRLAELAVPLDVLEHDDRVVDHDADGEREREQRHGVEREAEHPHEAEGRDQRDRDRRGDDQRRPRAAQEHEDGQHGEQRAEDQRELRLVDRLADRLREVRRRVVLLEREAGRQQRLHLVDALVGLVDDRDGVGAGLLADAEAHRRHAVEVRIVRGIGRAVLDARDVAEAHRRAVDEGDDQASTARRPSGTRRRS